MKSEKLGHKNEKDLMNNKIIIQNVVVSYATRNTSISQKYFIWRK